MLSTRYRAALCAALFAAAPSGASAQEVFAGVYVHGVNTPLSMNTGERGTDVAVGYRLRPLKALAAIGNPAPYAIASLNTVGDTSFVGAGLSWTIKLKGAAYVRPAVALVVQDGPKYRVDLARDCETDLGSRVLFEPEIGVGYRVSNRLSIEASWMHISQAGLFNAHQNPGLDMWGVRTGMKL